MCEVRKGSKNRRHLPSDFSCRNKSRGCRASPTRFTSDGRADRSRGFRISSHTEATRKYKGSGTSATILDCSVSCGPGQLEEQRILEYVRLPETVFGSGEMFLLRANGDSMVDAGIDDGDWVVIRKQNTAEEGDIVVALSDGLNNLKYFYRNRRKGCAILRSANEAKGYKDIEVYDLQIQGVAQNVIKVL